MTGTWESARQAMCAEIAAEVKETESFLGKAALDPRVMAAMAKVPRHLFVPVAYRAAAYDNKPLPIGEGQTISQPYIVAVMSDLAATRRGDRVLDVGTGCGYQAAVLAELGCQVYSIERHGGLVAGAVRNLDLAGYREVRLRTGDGLKGWPEAAPFHAILVAAAREGAAPPLLIEQLRAPGRMVIPLSRRGFFGRFGNTQELMRVIKAEDGELVVDSMLPVAFVPLIEEA
jgi:protein-L-isoaspartate(D-aspartate) O-methyltransferase